MAMNNNNNYGSAAGGGAFQRARNRKAVLFALVSLLSMVVIVTQLFSAPFPLSSPQQQPQANDAYTGEKVRKGITIRGDAFYNEDTQIPLRIISGEFHYFRTPRAYWKDRLTKMYLGGLNTVSLYVPWNMHEPAPGAFNFTGELDLGAVIREAEALGLYVIVRPGPYICAEWEFGGLPPWLLAKNLRIRSSDPAFLEAADAYLERVLSIVRPLQYTRGGPVIAMQIENEYGSFGSDMQYMKHLKHFFLRSGIDCILFDSNNRLAIRSERIDGVLRTVNFGALSSPSQILGDLRRVTRGGPLFVTEFWTGWFDHWTEPQHMYFPRRVVESLVEILQTGSSINFYMYVGGTNFGFMNGANYHQKAKLYQPTVTSYDYDAPVSESGDVTPMWYSIRDVLSKYVSVPELPASFEVSGAAHLPRASYGGTVTASLRGHLFDAAALGSLAQKAFREWTCAMEDLGQSYGYILYESWLPVYPDTGEFSINSLHDYAYVYLGEHFLGTYGRNSSVVAIPPGVSTDQTLRLRILVENMGRINYGPQMINERKGITQGVYANERYLANWTMYTIPLEGSEVTKYLLETAEDGADIESDEDGPAFYSGVLSISSDDDADGDGSLADTYLDTSGLGKGVVFVNGVNIGRFWPAAGPQSFLYVPGVFLRRGRNDIVVFELQPKGSSITLKFVSDVSAL